MKEFTVKELDGDVGWLQCPRRNCKGTFAVNRGQFKSNNVVEERINTRPCPYCFRVSLVPGASSS